MAERRLILKFINIEELGNTIGGKGSIKVHLGNDFRDAYNNGMTYEMNISRYKPFYWVDIKVPCNEIEKSKKDVDCLLLQIMNCDEKPCKITIEYADKTMKYTGKEVGAIKEG